ncbi:hypothetical protein CNR33_00055 [Pseudomonas phage tabernarius]|uniref:Uncharacterized protein n=1 Tax=Pseudomonas phage tabernarius TaxID=2048978 RepID=A0A2H4P6V5_9CAUD|nr:hypothetical protein FDJ17_gp55 [Pseudomonas phage tabernarius]ATW57901.1 hypothetical protein CNR33_00055 [Pseudomonas phage tabernarius]
MTCKVKVLSLFGVEYRCRQFSAIEGMSIFDVENLHPSVLLSKTEVQTKKGKWKPLSDGAAINRHVVDKLGVFTPLQVLNMLMELVRKENFGFLSSWKGVRVPSRFLSDSKQVQSEYTTPMLAALINENKASLKELEEYYSLEDSFRMFDMLSMKNVNEALSNEAAQSRARTR